MTGYESKKAAAQAKVEGPIHVVCQCDKCKAQPADKPVEWVIFELHPVMQYRLQRPYRARRKT